MGSNACSYPAAGLICALMSLSLSSLHVLPVLAQVFSGWLERRWKIVLWERGL